MKGDLPLFRHQDLTRLKQRRAALLKRVQAMPLRSHRRLLKEAELAALTLKMIRLETEIGDRR